MLKRTIVLALMLASLATAQPTEIKVFQLSNRPAASAAETVRPLLSPAGTVLPDEQTNKLIVRDTPENLAQIEKLLQSIDVAAPQVMIKINFTGETMASGTNVGGGYQSPSGAFNATLNGRQNDVVTSGEMKLMVMSGEEGHIEIGRQLTYVQPYWQLANQWGLVPPGMVIFQNVTTGFAVKPRVVGDVVTVEVAPWMSYMSERGRGQITFSEASSTVRLKSGDSIMVGSGSQSSSRSDGAVGARAYGEKDAINAWQLMLGGSSGSSSQSSGFVITPTIIPDWSKE